ncbi:MAG TPA: tripartite tricarboxylate transporter substrate binding protein [Burkholderiales bacterium]|nr:tripartite tricarboxylate transporter substrate binding protein [Burkholderiales bacterium]
MPRLLAYATALGAAATLAGVLVAGTALGQGYPSKPIRLISPYPPGGGNDTLARALAQKLAESFGQQIVVDNRPGANTIIGTELTAKAPPDGYTLVLVPSSHASNTSLYARLPYDAIRDFAPVSLLGWGPLLLVTNTALPARNVRELIALAKARPGELTYGSAGNGAAGHLAGALFCQMAAIDMQHIPYKGTAPMVTDLIGGQVSLSFASTLSVVPQVKAGKLKALAWAGAQRSAVLPDLPTVAESGVPGYHAELWYGILAPAKTPKEIVARLNAEIVRALQIPELRGRLAGFGVEPRTSTPEEFARLIVTDTARWAAVVKASGARVE